MYLLMLKIKFNLFVSIIHWFHMIFIYISYISFMYTCAYSCSTGFPQNLCRKEILHIPFEASQWCELAFSSSLVCQSPAVRTGPGAEVHRCSPQAGSLIQVDQDLLTCVQLPVMDPPNLATIKGLIRGMHIDRCRVERD